ncbi:hypothetical protein [Antarctobacter heliothermus]|uniref:Uncharacterized protein n=1 Tax=Antarctobacter heliothermus TaxID=74033 RepID=A0A239KHB9_9RHOB|nr:hypothetical protein [Antarctobacter heliothermus]SNT17078.1 hypothetical protein SAMN04488078_10659 [Antarctobacter heliothermus]
MSGAGGDLPKRRAGKPSAGATQVHVERQTVRRRRLIDATCALPLLGWILWWLPLLWNGIAEPVPSSQALIYIFGVWIALAIGAGRLVHLLNRSRPVGSGA